MTKALTKSHRGSLPVCRRTYEVVLLGSVSTVPPPGAVVWPPSDRSLLSGGSPAHRRRPISDRTKSAAVPASAGPGGRDRLAVIGAPSSPATT